MPLFDAVIIGGPEQEKLVHTEVNTDLLDTKHNHFMSVILCEVERINTFLFLHGLS